MQDEVKRAINHINHRLDVMEALILLIARKSRVALEWETYSDLERAAERDTGDNK